MLFVDVTRHHLTLEAAAAATTTTKTESTVVGHNQRFHRAVVRRDLFRNLNSITNTSIRSVGTNFYYIDG